MKDLNFFADAIEKWLVTGELALGISDFSENFLFESPFWKKAGRSEFIAEFQQSSKYKDRTLSRIKSFKSVIKLKDKDSYFAIVLNYLSENGNSVWEAVLGKIENEKLSELRSIYDLNETKLALDLD